MPQESKSSIPPNTLAAAILQVAGMLGDDRESAEQASLGFLKKAPGQAQALALLIADRRLNGDIGGARDLLQAMAKTAPDIAAVQYELGQLQQEFGNGDAAIAAFSKTVEVEPEHLSAWRVLADALAKANRTTEAAQAYAKYFELSVPALAKIESAGRGEGNQVAAAETTLREWLQAHPTDVFARTLLGTLFFRQARYEDAALHLSKAVALAPNSAEARFRLAGTFAHRGEWNKALKAGKELLESDPENADYLDLKAFALLRLGELDAAAAAFQTLLAKRPAAEAWKNYGQALKATGKTQEAIAAYRKAISCTPTYGLAHWCLAELKTFRFDPADIEAMNQALETKNLGSQDRALIHFALGRAFEDAGQYENSFEHFRKANAVIRGTVRPNPDQRADFVRRNKGVFTPEFFRARSGWGTPRRDPIFLVGLPRAGSTLTEQILASHSLVEGTSELQALESIIRDLSLGERRKGRAYPELMLDLPEDEIRGVGETYLECTLPYRKLDRLFFIDKMPNNFSHTGMILTALPNAKIIDVRRHPLGGGFAVFKHYFLEAYSFAFDLTDIGRYYRQYVELMAHFDAVQPGRVHRVIYENLVADPQREIRKLLDYCGLPFEESCLKFYESKRAVLTPSAEQVRRPIYSDATELWRRYERWLDPLKAALGDVLERYPEVPEFQQSAPSLPLGFSRPIRWGAISPPAQRS